MLLAHTGLIVKHSTECVESTETPGHMRMGTTTGTERLGKLKDIAVFF